jgi:uncharacterized protein (TIGR03000 family)
MKRVAVFCAFAWMAACGPFHANAQTTGKGNEGPAKDSGGASGGYSYHLIHHHPNWPYPPYPYPPYPYPPYPYPYPYPAYPYGTLLPDFYQGTPDPNYSYSSMPTTAVLPPVDGNNAVVLVKVPLALADVTFNGTTTTTTGKTRVFTTPALEPGKTYSYSVTASWTDGGIPRTLTRTVQVSAGQTVTVDFSKKE